MSVHKAHNWHTFHDLNSRNKYASLNKFRCPLNVLFDKCALRNTIRFWSPLIIKVFSR